jgi:hypothetical protein
VKDYSVLKLILDLRRALNAQTVHPFHFIPLKSEVGSWAVCSQQINKILGTFTVGNSNVNYCKGIIENKNELKIKFHERNPLSYL